MSTAAEQSEIERRGQTLYSYDDYQQLPEDASYELIRGHLLMSPSPSVQHQDIVLSLGSALRDYIQAHEEQAKAWIAPLDVHLSDQTVVQPDVLYVSPERSDQIAEEEIAGAPDLVMEVVTPSTSYQDVTEKRELYAAHGVREYWIVNPDEETVEVLRSTEDGFVQHARAAESGSIPSALLDGLTIDLTALFQ